MATGSEVSLDEAADILNREGLRLGSIYALRRYFSSGQFLPRIHLQTQIRVGLAVEAAHPTIGESRGLKVQLLC